MKEKQNHLFRNNHIEHWQRFVFMTQESMNRQHTKTSTKTITMCTKTRIITIDMSTRAENTSNASKSALHSFLQRLIREKSHQLEEGNQEMQIEIRSDDAPGCEVGRLRQEWTRIGRSNSDPLPLKRSGVLDVSDHTKRFSRWQPMQPSKSASSEKKQLLSTTMVPLPIRNPSSPSSRRINAAKSA